MEEKETMKKWVELTEEEVKTIISCFAMLSAANLKVPVLYEEEIYSMDGLLLKLKKEFFPEDYMKMIN
jgi:hypothetical protein